MECNGTLINECNYTAVLVLDEGHVRRALWRILDTQNRSWNVLRP